MVHAAQAQTTNTCAMRINSANRALDQRHSDRACFFFSLGHDQPLISSTDLPRLAAISAGVFIDCKPFNVARTTLYGLLEPIHLASTLVTPITSKMARIDRKSVV